jgi:hypothetical protein
MNYTWRPAGFNDVFNIVSLTHTNHSDEFNKIFTVDPIIYERLIAHAVIDQIYTPSKELLTVAVDDSGVLLAYTWAKVTNQNQWSSDTMLIAQMAQVDLTLPTRLRIKIIKDIFNIWDEYAKLSDVSVICSNSILANQDAFLKLHQRAGFTVKGSYAYKKLSTEQTGLPIP